MSPLVLLIKIEITTYLQVHDLIVGESSSAISERTPWQVREDFLESGNQAFLQLPTEQLSMTADVHVCLFFFGLYLSVSVSLPLSISFCLSFSFAQDPFFHIPQEECTHEKIPHLVTGPGKSLSITLFLINWISNFCQILMERF